MEDEFQSEGFVRLTVAWTKEGVLVRRAAIVALTEQDESTIVTLAGACETVRVLESPRKIMALLEAQAR